jgi:hypothetical protein
MEHEQVRRRGEDPLLWLIVHLLVGLLLSAIAATLAFYCFAVGYAKTFGVK